MLHPNATFEILFSTQYLITREEAFAIRYHMGFSTTDDANQVGRALEMFPLAYALCMADMEASYYVEGSPLK